MRARLANFLATTAATIAGTFIPLYAHQLGADDVGVGLLAALSALTVTIAGLLAGRAADRYGTRQFIVLGLLASAISTLLQVFAFDFVSLVVLRALNGLALGVYPAALISHVQASKERLGQFSAFGSLGWTAGSLLAGTIATYFTIRGTFVAASLLFFIAYLLALRFGVRPPDPTPQKTASLWEVFLSKRSTFISVLIRHIGAHMIWAFWPLFLQQLGGGLLLDRRHVSHQHGNTVSRDVLSDGSRVEHGAAAVGLIAVECNVHYIRARPKFLVDPAHTDTVGHLMGAAVRGGLAGGDRGPSQPWGCLGDLYGSIEHLDGHRAGTGSVACAHRGVLSAHLCRSRAVVRSVPLQTNQPCALPRERASPVRGLAQMSLQGGAPHAMLKP
jgi:hypothetical protein